MAIVEADLNYRLSGGVPNTDPNDSIGGSMSTAAGGIILTNTDNNDMNDITSDEAAAGITIYHGYFYENTNVTLTWTTPVFWIESQTSSGDTTVNIAVALEAKNLPIELLANEETSPAGVTFTAPANKAAGIAIGSLDPTENRGTWVEYIVNGGAVTVLDQYTIKAEGDTQP